MSVLRSVFRTSGGGGSSVPTISGIYNFSEVAPAFASLRTNRLQVIGIGDSNQVFAGHGNDDGFQHAFKQHYQCFATGWQGGCENEGLGAAIGHEYQQVSPGASQRGTHWDVSVDNEFHTIRNISVQGLGVIDPFYGIDEVEFNGNNGIVIVSNSTLIPAQDRLKYQIYYGTFATGDSGAQIAPAIRRNSSPFNNLATIDPVPTVTGADAILFVEVEKSANPTHAGLIIGARFDGTHSQTIGPYGIYWQRLERPDITAGFAYSTLIYMGGQSLKDMAVVLQGLSDESLALYFQALMTGMSTGDKYLFTIDSGVNDRNESDTSVGPNPNTDGDSQSAYKDNLLAIIRRIEQVWVAQGGDVSDIYFLSIQNHPVDDPDDAELIAYTAAAKDLSDEIKRLAVWEIREFADEADFVAGGWYVNSVTDRNHLTEAGYRGKFALLADAIHKKYPPA